MRRPSYYQHHYYGSPNYNSPQSGNNFGTNNVSSTNYTPSFTNSFELIQEEPKEEKPFVENQSEQEIEKKITNFGSFYEGEETSTFKDLGLHAGLPSFEAPLPIWETLKENENNQSKPEEKDTKVEKETSLMGTKPSEEVPLPFWERMKTDS